MQLEGYAALITALVGAVIGIAGLLRSTKADNKATRLEGKSKAIEEKYEVVDSYQEIVKTLREDLDRIRREHALDRENWLLEKNQLLKMVDLKTRENSDLRSEVKTLTDKVDHLTEELESYRTGKLDKRKSKA